MSTFAALPLTQPHGTATLAAMQPSELSNVSVDAPALSLFTDLRLSPAISVLDTTPIDTALEQMIYSGIKLLFVVQTGFELRGLITADDIVGEKPLLFLQSQDGHIGTGARADIEVGHIMQPVSDWKTLDFSAVQHARVGDIVETFKKSGRHHLIALEQVTSPQKLIVRGLFSATKIERELGIRLDIMQRHESFADLERALV